MMMIKRRNQDERNDNKNKQRKQQIMMLFLIISNDIINESFTGSYMPQPFARNSTVIGTSFNESAIMDREMEKMSRLNITSNMSLNQSGLAPPQLTRPSPPQLTGPAAPSTIAPASPSVAPQSLNFNLSSPVRPVGMTPLQASSMAMNAIQNYAMASMKAAINSQEAIAKLFQKVTDKSRLIPSQV
jgi:hypothetical protein